MKKAIDKISKNGVIYTKKKEIQYVKNSKSK